MITAHRRENLGEPMHNMFRAIRRVMEEVPDVKAIYPIHRNPVVRQAAEEELGGCDRIHIIEPLEVLDFHNFLARSFMILTDSPMKAVWFLVFFIILQQFEGNVIYPKVMGSRVNLPSMWILAAVTVGGGIGGPIGMLLGVPLVSTAYVLFKEETEKRALSLAKSEPKKTEEKPGEESSEAAAEPMPETQSPAPEKTERQA
jgi:hypothetical protein